MAIPIPCRKGDEIHGLDAAAKLPGKVFHAGTALDDEGRIVTSGGRVLCAVGLGTTVRAAQKQAYELVGAICWQGMQFRKDIGYRAIAREAETANYVNLLVVDVQPEYSATCAGVARQLSGCCDQAARAARQGARAFRRRRVERGSRTGRTRLLDGPRRRGTTNSPRVTFLEKGYNFFRGWMDNGVDPARDRATPRNRCAIACAGIPAVLAPEELIALGADPTLETLYMPGCLEGHAPRFEGTRWSTCGGGVTECLLETELWMRSRDIAFERTAAVY